MSTQPPFGPDQPPFQPPGGGLPPYGQAPPPYQPPGGGPYGPAQVENAPNAVLSLVLGIVGIVVCSIAAPFAWVLGKKAEAEVDANPGRYTGKGMATAGKILGIIGTVLIGVAIIALIILIIVAVATGGSS
ncbi:MAG: DUF4190 domain-containing protein [Solirubrobacteraceae bacterium]